MSNLNPRMTQERAASIRADGAKAKKAIIAVLRRRAVQKDRGNVGISNLDLLREVWEEIEFRPPSFNFLLMQLEAEGAIRESDRGLWYIGSSTPLEILSWAADSSGS